jgi:hypothetical protein
MSTIEMARNRHRDPINGYEIWYYDSSVCMSHKVTPANQRPRSYDIWHLHTFLDQPKKQQAPKKHSELVQKCI